MKIGVSGASGALGRMVIANLLGDTPHQDIIAISRTPGATEGVQGRVGDYDKPDTLVQAYAGLDRLLLIPSADLRPGVLSAQIAAGIDAAVAAGVGHIFLLSGAGARRASGYADHWAGEQRLIRSAARRWTILRMGFFAETFIDMAKLSLASGELPGLSENRAAFVSKQDVAAAIAGALRGGGQDGATYNLSGPVSLSGLQRAGLIAAASRQPLAFAVIAQAQLRAGLAASGLPDFLVDAFVAMQKAFSDGAYDIVTGDIERLSGRPPRHLADILATAFA